MNRKTRRARDVKLQPGKKEEGKKREERSGIEAGERSGMKTPEFVLVRRQQEAEIPKPASN